MENRSENRDQRHAANPIRATVIGGFVFLAPLAVAVFVVAQVANVTRGAAMALAPELQLGVLRLNLLVGLCLLLICYLAGLVAQWRGTTRLQKRLERLLIRVLPGYGFVNSITEGMRRGDGVSGDFRPVLVDFDDYTQLAFEIERQHDHAAVYLPGAPSPWSGSFVYVAANRVRSLNLKVPEAMELVRYLGKGSMEAVERGVLSVPDEGTEHADHTAEPSGDAGEPPPT